MKYYELRIVEVTDDGEVINADMEGIAIDWNDLEEATNFIWNELRDFYNHNVKGKDDA